MGENIKDEIQGEMARLRAMLTEMGVEWRDDSTNYPTENPFFDKGMSITRTKYNYKGYEYSVICGYGTYGGDEGLLEVWIDRKGEPTGWHTADDIIAMMKGK